MNKLYGLDEKDHQEAQDDQQRGMAAIAYPLLAIAAVAACAWLASVLPGVMP